MGSEDIPAGSIGTNDISIDEQETEEIKPLCVEKYLVSVEAEIDYIDKNGNQTTRNIRTDEIYDYDDEVLVVRAYCFTREDYRTFVSKRIHRWQDIRSSETIKYDQHDDHDLREYLKEQAKLDPENIAKEIYEHYIHEINIAVGSLVRWAKKTQGTNDLVKWIISKEFSESILSPLGDREKDEVWDALSQVIRDEKGRIGVTAIKGSVRTLLRATDARKNDLVGFVERSLEGEPSKESAVQTLKDDLGAQGGELGYPIPVMDPPSTEVVQTIKEEAAATKRKYKKRRRKRKRSKDYRAAERKDPVKLLTIGETLRRLAGKVNSGDLVFDKEIFESEIRNEISKALTGEEIKEQGDMFLKRLGQGISVGYVNFGLKKKTKGWYKDSSGRDVIDLRNATTEINET